MRKNSWANDELELLVNLSNSKLKNKWKKISGIIGTKTAMQCVYKYRKLNPKNRIKFKKSNDDDYLIKNKRVSDFFSQVHHVDLKQVSWIKTNIDSNIKLFSHFPVLQADEIPPIPRFKNDSLEYINSTLIKQSSKGIKLFINTSFRIKRYNKLL